MRSTVYTLACAKCCRGWSSDRPEDTCTGCGQTCQQRGSYVEVGL